MRERSAAPQWAAASAVPSGHSSVPGSLQASVLDEKPQNSCCYKTPQFRQLSHLSLSSRKPNFAVLSLSKMPLRAKITNNALSGESPVRSWLHETTLSYL